MNDTTRDAPTAPRPSSIRALLLLGAVLCLLAPGLAGCQGAGYTRVKPTPINQAVQEVPEDQLLDVGVRISAVPEMSAKKLKKQGTTEEIRQAESHFIPYHLKNTLQSSSHWGSVQVVPQEDEYFDLVLASTLVESNGEYMKFEVEATDASGHVWMKRKYYAKVQEGGYANTAPGEREAFQDLFNTIANDLSAFKGELSPEEIERIRTVSRLKFAQEFAPDAFDDYLAMDRKGRVSLERVPSDDDPLMARIDVIRGREQMFVETLNQYYEGYYMEMWEPYENWRRYYLAELLARRQAESEAFWRVVGGIVMIAGAIALQAGDIDNSGALTGTLIVGGGQVIVSGINITEQVKIHTAAIQELAESFGDEMRPTVIELEGKRYELVGTAGEQYLEWKDLLREIYFEETGFGAGGEPVDGDADPDAVEMVP